MKQQIKCPHCNKVFPIEESLKHEAEEIRKKYIFTQYTDAIIFTNKIAELSEKEGHHPFIHINYKKVIIILFTHKINGLHENDFILASKCDLLFKSLQ